eukprot:gene28950-38292_t
MFIKKDLRKIDEILVDENDKREILKLSKRSYEFQGEIKVLFSRPEYSSSSYSNLKTLNLYDNGLMNINGIGILSQTPLEELNVGCNRLSSLPLEFGSLSRLKTLWLDDNDFQELPTSVCQLRDLISLKCSGNALRTVPSLISMLSQLETLALDNNEIEEFPSGVLKLSKLKHLWLRQNKLIELPENINALSSLVTLSVSSNNLTSLPESVTEMTSLQFIYANGNKLSSIPTALHTTLPNLQVLHFANNLLSSIPDQWGPVDQRTGSIVRKDEGTNTTLTVHLLGNPFIQATKV